MEQLTIKNNTLSPKETAQYLGISISTLWRFMRRNDFPKPKTPNRADNPLFKKRPRCIFTR